MKDLKELLIALDECNREIERIKNDNEYIEKRVNEIFGDKKYSFSKEEIEKLL